jgi:hypothetical protein
MTNKKPHQVSSVRRFVRILKRILSLVLLVLEILEKLKDLVLK